MTCVNFNRDVEKKPSDEFLFLISLLQWTSYQKILRGYQHAVL